MREWETVDEWTVDIVEDPTQLMLNANCCCMLAKGRGGQAGGHVEKQSARGGWSRRDRERERRRRRRRGIRSLRGECRNG